MLTVGVYWRTLRHLTLRQLAYQVWNRVFRPGVSWTATFGRLKDTFLPDVAVQDTSIQAMFTFLNQTVNFSGIIDWNYAENGKLWAYHLTYFDYLNEPEPMPAGRGLALIRHFMAQSHALRDGLDPYPTSRRIQNWVRFLHRNAVQDGAIDAHLRAQTRLLRGRLEYHIGGNHLLENGFALLTAALYFRQRRWYRRSVRLIRIELTAQVLADGGHYERSPAYHQEILVRLRWLLDSLRATNGWPGDSDLLSFLEQKAAQMQNWLTTITFRNGDLPRVNDGVSWRSSTTTAPDVAAGMPDVHPTGYHLFRWERYELLVDTGAIGPDHQPGHGHADTFSFVLYVDDKPLLVDAGTSTYQPGERRQWERSTAAHNTVEVAGQDSSEVWATFRVGRRARVTALTYTETTLTARHDGYRHLGLTHERSWTPEPDQIKLTDRIIGQRRGRNYPAVARFHVHPDAPVQLTETGAIVGPFRLVAASDESLVIRLTEYWMAEDFNQLRPGVCVEITFTTYLQTILQWHENSLSDFLF